MDKFLVTIEFRYRGVPDDYGSEYNNKTVTIGVFDDFDTACLEGNKLMKTLESKFPLHVFPDDRQATKERFSKNGGCFGSASTLITNMGYLSTPFDFYAKIQTLKMRNIENAIDEVIDSVRKYKKYKLSKDT